MIPIEVIRRGSDAAAPAPVILCAGPLTLHFEPCTGWVRHVCLDEREVIRAIYAAVRDRNWGTVTTAITDLQISSGPAEFRIAFDVECKQHEIDFAWRSTIVGMPDGEIRYEMDGRARSTFFKNRIGFCVLHPINECAGRSCRIARIDGTEERRTFPHLISPHQPFKQIRAISHEVAPGVEAEVRFEGDIFEMEDERNWTDASFKTYCTPLGLPFPAEIRAGSVVEQAVVLHVRKASDSERQNSEFGIRNSELPLKPGEPQTGIRKPQTALGIVSIAIDASAPWRALPRIGLGVASHGAALSEQEVSRLRALRPTHLRVDLDLTGSDWKGTLQQAAAQARQLETFLEAAIFVSDAARAELDALAGELSRLRAPIRAWLVFHRQRPSFPEPVLQLAAEYLRRQTPDAKIGSGTNANFAEFNRHPPVGRAPSERPEDSAPSSLPDLVCYSINPQVHAFDDDSLMETLEAQVDTVQSAQRINGLPVAVTPITLKPRFNAVATGSEREPTPDELPAQVDVRQMSLFGAAWTLGSMKRLFDAGVQSVTYYETTGWRGIMETQMGSPLPDRFPSIAGGVFPMYHIFADVGEFRGGHLIPLTSAQPRGVDGLALRDGRRVRILLANLTPESQKATVPVDTATCHIRYLDETNGEKAMREPEIYRATRESIIVRNGFVEVDLRPYAVVCIDTEKDEQR